MFFSGLEYFLNGTNELENCQDVASATNAIRHFGMVAYLKEKEQMLASCPLPCKQLSYEVNVRKFHTNTWVVYDDQPIADIAETGVSISLSYESLIVEERIETLVYDVGNFLSAVGGNLGLFLGFSCLTMLLGILRAAKKFRRQLCFKDV